MNPLEPGTPAWKERLDALEAGIARAVAAGQKVAESALRDERRRMLQIEAATAGGVLNDQRVRVATGVEGARTTAFTTGPK